MISQTLAFTLTLLAMGQAGSPGKTDDTAARLTIMKNSLTVHELTAPGDPKSRFRLKAEPVLRFTNSVGAVSDGAIFFWLDDNDRPAAAVQVYKTTSGNWEHAYSSFATMPVQLGSAWAPSRPGVTFKSIVGAPKPADTAEVRLRQMREIVKGFTADMQLDFKTWHTLRLLPRPLARYGKAGSGVLDGWVLSFVLTTDPEVFLLIETREGKDGLEWQYAFAPEASAPLRCAWKGTNVWDFDAGSGIFDRSSPYCVRGFAPEAVAQVKP
jgi:hypothetical protein